MQLVPEVAREFLGGAVDDGQERYVRGGKDEFILFVQDSELRITMFKFETITVGRNDGAFVETVENFLGQPFYQPKIEYVAGLCKLAVDTDGDLIIMTMQRLTKARIGDEVCR